MARVLPWAGSIPVKRRCPTTALVSRPWPAAEGPARSVGSSEPFQLTFDRRQISLDECLELCPLDRKQLRSNLVLLLLGGRLPRERARQLARNRVRPLRNGHGRRHAPGSEPSIAFERYQDSGQATLNLARLIVQRARRGGCGVKRLANGSEARVCGVRQL